jgi:hypothetical protein
MRLADATTDTEAEQRLRVLAAEYLARAQRVEVHEAARAQIATGGPEEQPVVQEQQQTQPKKDDE